ncbi:MAG: putative oxidoreductase protein [Acidimicrobiales bacterium]|nr:putative oxidoreductase protein [Acidimicrobiales bacterium]
MDGGTRSPLPVGLVGAGPWATMVHAPMLAGAPETELAGVWARRPEAAAELAARHRVPARGSLDELFERCAAVAFAVPPAVQAELALPAAAAGKTLLLEKPIAADLDAAERLADAVGAAEVASLVLLTWRYAQPVRDLLANVAGTDLLGGHGTFLSDALRGGPFATPWRLAHGPLLDLGPHLVDVLDAALGPVVHVSAEGDRHGWVSLLLEHESGATSSADLCATLAPGTSRAAIAVHGPDAEHAIDLTSAVTPAVFATVAADLAAAAAGATRGPDVQRGLHVQRLLAQADTQIRG